MDFLFCIIGFIPCSIAVIWAFECHGEENKKKIATNISGAFFLLLAGLATIGLLRSLLNDNFQIALLVLDVVLYIASAICFFIKKNFL